MRVYGEAFFIMNGWMNFWCLALAGCLGRRRLRGGRTVLAACAGAVYAVAAWQMGPVYRSVPFLLLAELLMAVLAFGGQGVRLLPFIAAAGWLLCGLADFAVGRGASAVCVLGLGGAASLALAALLRRGNASGREALRLAICLDGKKAAIPALRDSGNLLREGFSGLPVIVASRDILRPLLPPAVDPGDLATLPAGWRLLPVRTAAGEKTLMCFRPDGMRLITKKTAVCIDGWVAVADFGESRALVPDAFFADQKEEPCYASL